MPATFNTLWFIRLFFISVVLSSFLFFVQKTFAASIPTTTIKRAEPKIIIVGCWFDPNRVANVKCHSERDDD